MKAKRHFFFHSFRILFFVFVSKKLVTKNEMKLNFVLASTYIPAGTILHVNSNVDTIIQHKTAAYFPFHFIPPSLFFFQNVYYFYEWMSMQTEYSTLFFSTRCKQNRHIEANQIVYLAWKGRRGAGQMYDAALAKLDHMAGVRKQILYDNFYSLILL